jgi:antitoxin component YwqK of YwqJK toxin-antitoxin module
LRFEGYCRNGTQDGPFTSYFANGGLQYQGEYKDGEEVGVWVHYAEDGSVASRINHDTPAGVEPTHPPEPETPEQRQ